MNNYTQEQRETIIGYLKNVLLEDYEKFEASYEQEMGISIDTIKQAIDDLICLKFKSIKNIVGTKFKIKMNSIEEQTYGICFYEDYERNVLINLKTLTIIDLYSISDNEKVEVINE